MAPAGEFGTWTVGPDDLAGIDPARARDLLVECFYDAQRATFARSKQKLGKDVSEETLRRSVKAAVRVAFEQAGGDYDQPTRASVEAAVAALAKSAASWGTPAPVIEHHRRQAEKILGALEG